MVKLEDRTTEELQQQLAEYELNVRTMDCCFRLLGVYIQQSKRIKEEIKKRNERKTV